MQEAAKNSSNRSLSVIVVEDDRDMGRLIEAMLRDMKITRVKRVSDGKKALQEFKSDPDHYQIVISDWEMPEMNGLELLKAVQSIRPDTLFMMLTARAEADAIVEARNANVTAYIAKPFSPRQLQVKMQTLLQTLIDRRKKAEPKVWANDAYEI